MKNLLLGIIAINLTFISVNTHAFEFEGVKSGMTKEEIIALGIKFDGVRSKKLDQVNWKSIIDWVPHLDVDEAVFVFDHNLKLYGLNITFEPSDDSTAASIGERRAVQEFCNAEYFESILEFGCNYRDDDLLRDAIEHYKKMKLENLK